MIPDVPKTAKIAIERERYFARLALEGEPPALDEYWSDDKNDSSLFSARGSLLLPPRIITGGNMIQENPTHENKERQA